MKRTAAILLATVFGMTAVPALADWERVGSVDFSAGDTHDYEMGTFKGNVMGLTARGADVTCNRVSAQFVDGTMRPIFKGKLPQGQSVRVDLPPGTVDRVTFDCHPGNAGKVSIDIAADAGGSAAKTPG
jgi:hypothetical protein